jgi:hypothetical protein
MNKKGTKQKESKKADQKKKTKIIEDKTFGLKNKNKSKKVQAHIQSVTKNVLNSGDPKERKKQEVMKMQKAAAKARKKAMEEERNALFGEALLAVQKKTSVQTKGISNSKGRDADEPKEKSGQSRAMKMMFQMDAKEMEDALLSDVSYMERRKVIYESVALLFFWSIQRAMFLLTLQPATCFFASYTLYTAQLCTYY